jgi:hypothetical protein
MASCFQARALGGLPQHKCILLCWLHRESCMWLGCCSSSMGCYSSSMKRRSVQ